MRGTIRARGKGRWQVQVYAGRGPDGRERRVARTIHGTRRDADHALAALVLQVEAGQHRGAPNTRSIANATSTDGSLMPRRISDTHGWLIGLRPRSRPTSAASSVWLMRLLSSRSCSAFPKARARPVPSSPSLMPASVNRSLTRRYKPLLAL